MASSAAAAALVRKFFCSVFLVGLIVAAILPVRAEAARLLSSGDNGHHAVSFNMEADDLSLEQQRQVMDMGEIIDGVTRKLLTQDPYYTKY